MVSIGGGEATSSGGGSVAAECTRSTRSATTWSGSMFQDGSQILATCGHPMTFSRKEVGTASRSVAIGRLFQEFPSMRTATSQGAGVPESLSARSTLNCDRPRNTSTSIPLSSRRRLISRMWSRSECWWLSSSVSRFSTSEACLAARTRYSLRWISPSDLGSRMSSGSKEDTTTTCFRARVTATLRRRSPPLLVRGPKLSGRVPSPRRFENEVPITITSRSRP